MTDDRESTGLTRRRALALGGATLGSVAVLGTALGQEDDGPNGTDTGPDGGNRRYRVTVADLTSGQPLTPPAIALHRPDVEVFAVGEPANTATQQLAENGNLDPLTELLSTTESVRASAVADGPLVPKSDPGDTGLPYYRTIELSADASATHMTVASMLIATNDGMTALDTVPLPEAVNESRTYYANGYDVGTEQNTERYEDLVPPAQSLIQGGEATGGTTESNPDIAEDDVIRPHPGIRGVGDLDPDVYDWREPASLVQVERLDGTQPGTETPTGTETGTETQSETPGTPGTETGTPGTPGTETGTETGTGM
ncbi:MAG: spondin domain-containing protein [Haloarculaceae archaeon]